MESVLQNLVRCKNKERARKLIKQYIRYSPTWKNICSMSIWRKTHFCMYRIKSKQIRDKKGEISGRWDNRQFISFFLPGGVGDGGRGRDKANTRPA